MPDKINNWYRKIKSSPSQGGRGSSYYMVTIIVTIIVIVAVVACYYWIVSPIFQQMVTKDSGISLLINENGQVTIQ
jgi:hypothetical protein